MRLFDGNSTGPYCRRTRLIAADVRGSVSSYDSVAIASESNRIVAMCQGNFQVIGSNMVYSTFFCEHFFLRFRSPARLVDLSVILYVDKNQGQSCSDDMALFRL